MYHMSVTNKEELAHHIGHRVVVVEYGDGASVAVECEDCMEVLLDFEE